MSNLPKEFEGDAFISYAHLDNIGLVEGQKGWVANLHRALEVRVGQLHGKSAHIWRDPKLQGNDLFENALVEKLKHVAVLVTVVSPRYLKSEWTMRELREFLAAAEEQGGTEVAGKARIFKVLKTPVPLDKVPDELKMVLGYEFFKVDPDTGKVRELDEVFGPEAQREFWTRLDDLAHDIVTLLEAIDHQGDVPLPSASIAAPVAQAVITAVASKGTVYLAQTTSDLRDHADRLRRDLLQHGYTVLPTTPLPDVADEAEAAIRANLAQARLSVHLIGRNYSLVPEGGQVSLIEMQHDLAAARGSDPQFHRLSWAPDGQQVSDARQQKVIERISMDPRGDSHADFMETMFEDLRTAVMDRLSRAPKVQAPPASSPANDGPAPVLYLMADQRDADAIQPWADALFDQGVEVIRPLFDGDESEIREYHEENLRLCDGVLIFYGAGNELWLQRKLRELQKAPGYGRTKPKPAAGVCLIGARTPEKERFRSHDAVVAPQWDGVALGALAPLLARLKAGGPV
jgi:TIR domain